MSQITFNQTELHLVEDEKHEFLISNKEVSSGYGTTIQNLAHTKNNHKDELIENKHWIRLQVQTKGGKQSVIYWTKRGIVRLGFFIKSQEAKAFRDWAEDYIVNPNTLKNPQQVIGGYKGVITKLQIKVRELEAGLVPVPTTRDLSKELLAIVEKGLKYDALYLTCINAENILVNMSRGMTIQELAHCADKYGADDFQFCSI